MSLPPLAVNRQFMSEFIAADPSCLALGLVEVGDTRCALVALRLEETLPQSVTAGGFRFGHSLRGASSWKVVHFAFEFYGFAIYNVLINPSESGAGGGEGKGGQARQPAALRGYTRAVAAKSIRARTRTADVALHNVEAVRRAGTRTSAELPEALTNRGVPTPTGRGT